MKPSLRAMLFGFSPPNLLRYSEEFDSYPTWDKTGATISSNATTAPNGTLTADKLIASANTAAHFTSQVGVGKVMSVYAKAAENGWLLLYSGVAGSNIYFNLTTGAVGTALADVASHEILLIGDGWYRCSVVWNTPSTEVRIYGTTGNGTTSWTGDGSAGIYIWGAMLNNGPRAGKYRKTPA